MEALRVVPALVVALLAGMAPALHAQTVAIRTVSPSAVTVEQDGTPARVTVAGTGLEAVSGAEVRMAGRATRRIEVTLGRLARGILPLDLVAVESGGEIVGELFLLTRRGAVSTGLAVTVPAPAFVPVVLGTARLEMSGFRVPPVSVATSRLEMSGFRVAAVTVKTTGLTMTGFRLEPVVVRTRMLTMTGYRSGGEENR